MKLIVGLGNPGNIYLNSRHNIGFFVVKALAKTYRIALKKDRDTFALSGKGRIGEERFILAMPLTFMNLSGKAVDLLLKKYELRSEHLLVVCDDLALDFGRLKIRPQGSSGGHKGLGSIIEALGSERFARLRIGTGRPASKKVTTEEFVLAPFTKEEKRGRRDIIETACDCCELWIKEGIEKCMNIFNRRSGQ